MVMPHHTADAHVDLGKVKRTGTDSQFKNRLVGHCFIQASSYSMEGIRVAYSKLVTLSLPLLILLLNKSGEPK